MPYWDATTSIAIIFTALVTPYEVAFLPMATNGLETLFLINRVLDGIFILDMYVQFVPVTSVADDASSLARDPLVRGMLRAARSNVVRKAAAPLKVVLLVACGKQRQQPLTRAVEVTMQRARIRRQARPLLSVWMPRRCGA